MGYLGTKPANQITDSTLIADGTITTSDLASGLTVNFADGSASTPSITNDGDTNTGIFFPAADTIAFAEGGAEIARFDSNGNLGIGTSSPTNYANYKTLTISSAGTSQGGVLRVQNSDSSTVGLVYIDGNTSYNIKSVASVPLIFGTADIERMRIDSSGNLLVGKTTEAAGSLGFSATPSFGFRATHSNNNFNIVNILSASGTQTLIQFRYNDSPVGGISSGGSSVTYNTTSDYRLKENVAPMTGALAKVAQLKPCTYTWKATGEASQGFIAHELQEVVPECVTGEKDAVEEDGSIKAQGIDTSFLVATLTAAIQEQQAIITEQSLALTDLKARIETLENK